MARSPYKFYSVYDRDTDLPIIIHATIKECVAQLGVTEETFRSYVSHTKHGTRSDKYLIYVDDPEGDEDATE